MFQLLIILMIDIELRENLVVLMKTKCRALVFDKSGIEKVVFLVQMEFFFCMEVQKNISDCLFFFLKIWLKKFFFSLYSSDSELKQS